MKKTTVTPKKLWAIVLTLVLVLSMFPMTSSAVVTLNNQEDSATAVPVYADETYENFSYENTEDYPNQAGLFVYGNEGDTYVLTEDVGFLFVTDATVVIDGNFEFYGDIRLAGTGSVQKGNLIGRCAESDAIALNEDANALVNDFFNSSNIFLIELAGDAEFFGEVYGIVTNGNTLTIPKNEALLVNYSLDATGGSVEGDGVLLVHMDAALSGITLYEADGTTPWTKEGFSEENCLGMFMLADGKWCLTDEPAPYEFTLVLAGGQQYENEVGTPVAEPVPGLFWDGESNSWTFDNVIFATLAPKAIVVMDEVTVNLLGESVFTCSPGQDNSTAMTFEKDVVFTGNGSLTAITEGSNEAEYYEGFGIVCRENITVDGSSVIAIGNLVGESSIGIDVGGNLTVSDGALSGYSGNGSEISIGIRVGGNGKVTVSGGSLTAMCLYNGNADYGIVADKDSITVLSGITIFMGNTGVTAYWNEEDETYSAFAPQTGENISVFATATGEEADNAKIENWKGDGTDDVSEYKLIILTEPFTEIVIGSETDQFKVLDEDTIVVSPDLELDELVDLLPAEVELLVEDEADRPFTGMKIVLRDFYGEVIDEMTIVVMGDLDGNGYVMAADARLALRQSVGLENLDEIYVKAAKVGGADKINAEQARLILRASVGLDTKISLMG